jgi:hypothetical protein
MLAFHYLALQTAFWLLGALDLPCGFPTDACCRAPGYYVCVELAAQQRPDS